MRGPSTRIFGMSIFGWFKSAAKPNNEPVAFARDARFNDPKDAAVRAAEASAAERRKDERARLRELLFKAVRESMVRVGVLSSSFKFKVLATDPRGKKFIVMMDLSRDFGGEVSQLAEIEKLICRSAKAHYNIAVSAVYWRAEDVMSSRQIDATSNGEKDKATVPGAAATATPAVARGPNAPLANPGTPKRGYEPVLADEISALKQALAAGAATTVNAGQPAAAGQTARVLTGYETTEIIESELPDTRLPDTEIPETELLDDEPPYPALSATQYGELR